MQTGWAEHLRRFQDRLLPRERWFPRHWMLPARNPPKLVDWLLRKSKLRNTNAIVGDWLTQVANGKVVRLTDGTATFLVSSFDATEQTITLIPADGVSSVIAPTSLTYGIDQGYVRLPLILGS